MEIPVRCALVLALATLGVASECRSELIVDVEMVSADPGDSGFLQVLLTNDSATDRDLSGFSVDLELIGPGVQLISADDQTTPGYLFGASGSGILTFDPFPNAGFLLQDLFLDAPGFTTLGAGQTVGLGRIAFRVAGDAAAGFRPLVILPGPGTEFTDGDSLPIAGLVLSDGGIMVGMTAIPEPSTMLMCLGALALVGGTRIRRRLAA
jgi:hypothetical protein